MNIWGWLTVVLFTIAWIPQIYKTWSRKSVSDISLGSLFVPLLAGICGLVYASEINNLTLLVGYTLGIMCTGTLVVMYFLYK